MRKGEARKKIVCRNGRQEEEEVRKVGRGREGEDKEEKGEIDREEEGRGGGREK